jgi:hypothetical protein
MFVSSGNAVLRKTSGFQSKGQPMQAIEFTRSNRILLRVCYRRATHTRRIGFLDDENRVFAKGKFLTVWQKGQSGNRKGRPRKRLVDDHLREALAKNRGAAAKALVQRLIGEAIQGNVPALKLICERIGGKPKSAEEVAANNSDAMTLDQVRAKLAELLARPEVRRSLQTMLTESKPETDTVQ